ncbi:MAG: phosphatidate cytidylyltransferase [Firmicutes bacterium]|nr:phosphatidate cytidylyltransferase [Bacillota bacterium]
MKTRIISGLIMLPLLIIVILRGWVLFAGCFVLSLLAVYEFFRGFRELDIKPSYPIAAGSTILLYVFGLLGNIDNEDCMVIFSSKYIMLLWVFVTVLACLLYLFKIEERKLEDAMVTLVGIFYVVFFCYHLAMLGMLDELSITVWLVVITAFGTDICAYFAGVTMGKHKLCPVISPKKTWEGAIGGVLGSVILCGLFGLFFMKYSIVLCLIVGFLGSIISMFGDLTASIFKRKMGIKDYGNLIPGHGGIMDRFDSILFTAPLVYYAVSLIIVFGSIGAWD